MAVVAAVTGDLVQFPAALGPAAGEVISAAASSSSNVLVFENEVPVRRRRRRHRVRTMLPAVQLVGEVVGLPVVRDLYNASSILVYS